MRYLLLKPLNLLNGDTVAHEDRPWQIWGCKQSPHVPIGERNSNYLPQLHAITGCDTTSFFYWFGNVWVWKNWERMLISSFAKWKANRKAKHLSQKGIKDITRFVQTIIYTGKFEECLVESRIRYYKFERKDWKRKAQELCLWTQILQTLQSYYWLQFQKLEITNINLENNGWYVDAEDKVLPVWFTSIW